MKANFFAVLFLGGFVGTLILFGSQLEFHKYRIKLVRSYPRNGAETVEFADMNGDGIDDLFVCGASQMKIRVNGCVCRLLDHQGNKTTLDQFNVPTLVKSGTQVHFSDFDHDGFNEVWLLSGENDQAILYGFEGPDLNGYKYRYYLDSAKTSQGHYSISFDLQQKKDVNEDGFDELFFYLSNGFPIHPRRSYRLDIHNDTLIKGMATSAGFNVCHTAEISDSQTYLTGNTTSAGNHKEWVHLPYPDTKNYVYALDENLNFLFEPIPIANYPAVNHNFAIGSYVYSVSDFRSTKAETKVQKRDAITGNLISSKTLDVPLVRSHYDGNNILLFFRENLIILDSDLKQVDKIALAFPVSTVNSIDLDGKAGYEHILINEATGARAVLDHKLSSTAPLPDELNTHLMVTRKIKNQPTEFVTLQDDKALFFTYTKNPLYYFKWPYYASVFIFSFGLSFLLFRFYRKNIEDKFEKEREFNRLQILSLKNQIDPHFALNALNSIDWMYKQEEPEKASRFMETYSRLVHQTVNSSDKISVSLFEELSFCRKFCELEKMRDPDFEYRVSVSEDIDSFELEVPRQLIFTHVENAVKHGLRPKDGDRRLKIEVHRKTNDLDIKIENNGLPYRKRGATSGTGKGLEIHQQLIDLYYDLKKIRIQSEIGTCEKVEGTCVKVVLKRVFEDTH